MTPIERLLLKCFREQFSAMDTSSDVVRRMTLRDELDKVLDPTSDKMGYEGELDEGGIPAQ